MPDGKHGKRDGLAFEIIPSEGVAAVVASLCAISSSRLQDHNAKEKSFSLGAFEVEYVNSQPGDVLKKDGKIVAFANILVAEASLKLRPDLSYSGVLVAPCIDVTVNEKPRIGQVGERLNHCKRRWERRCVPPARAVLRFNPTSDSS